MNETLRDTGFQIWTTVIIVLIIIFIGGMRGCTHTHEMEQACAEHCQTGFHYGPEGCVCHQ
jgi:hypothetical protein